MIRVMIVEDEPPINRLLQALVSEHKEDFQIVSAVYDGKEALDILPEILPDVVFTDIKMPGIDGTELVRHLRSNYPDIIPVVITGYGDYESIRAMLQQQVFDYLLKPINRVTMDNLLQNIKKANEDTIKKRVHQYFSQNVYHYLADRDLDLSSKYQCLVVSVVCVGAFPSSQLRSYTIPDRIWDKYGIVFFRQPQYDIWGLPGHTASEFMYVLGFRNKLEHDIRTACNYLWGTVPSQYPCTMLCSNSLDPTADIGLELNLLRNMLVLYTEIGKSRLVMDCTFHSRPDSHRFSTHPDQLDLLYHHINQTAVFQFEQQLNEIFLGYQKEEATQYTISRELKQIIQRLEQMIDDKSSYDHYYADLMVDESILNSLSLTQLRTNFLYICTDIFKIIERSKENKTGLRDLVSEVTDFLDQNYNKNITYQSLEEHFCFSSSYICQLFKKHNGVSPNKYLLQQRVKRACELIQNNPDITAKILSEQLGISDPLYFYKVFKNETGYTLSEYKALFCS